MKLLKRLGNDQRAREILHQMSHWLGRSAEELDPFLTGNGFEVEIRKVQAKQTDSQRGYYWQALKGWGSELGYSAKESENWLHNAVLCEAYGVKETKRIGGSIVEIPKERSSKQDRENYGLLIETMIRMAAESGHVVEPPQKLRVVA